MEIKCLFLLEQLQQKYIQLFASQAHSTAIPKRIDQYLMGNLSSKTMQSKLRSITDCMHDLSNLENLTTNSTLSLHSRHN